MTEEREKTYLAIDLKSFYASVECADRGLDPLTTNLVVADESRTEKTICLAVSPSLKSYGIPGRPRLFEVNQAVRALNAERRRANGPFRGKSVFAAELADPSLEVDFLIAKPRMARYMDPPLTTARQDYDAFSREAVDSALGYVSMSRSQIDFLKKAELSGQTYEIRFYKGGMAYSFSVDAASGAVLAYSQDFA